MADAGGGLVLIKQETPGGAFQDDIGTSGFIPGVTTLNIGPISIARNVDGTLEAALTANGSLWHLHQRVANQPLNKVPQGWKRQEFRLPGDITALVPVVAANRDGRLEVFLTASDGNIWHHWQTAPNIRWSEWESLGGPRGGEMFSSVDVGQNQDGRLEVFAVYCGELWHTWQTE